MELCISIAKIFSTCSKRQYGCILIDDLGHVVGFGYNGGPKNTVHCNEGGCPRLANNSPNGSSYDDCIAIHAEANAFLHSDYSSRATKLYVNGPPCFYCAKLIANSTIKDVYYMHDNAYKDWNNVNKFLYNSGISTWDLSDASI